MIQHRQSKSEDQSIVLRAIEEKDAYLLMELNNDSQIARCVVGNPTRVTLQEQLQWMERIKSETKTIRFIVEMKGIPVGTVIVSDLDNVNQTANLNIKLMPSAQGKGVGKKSIRLAQTYCFDTLGVFCLTAHVLDYNTASRALFEKTGFTCEGIMRSRVVKEGKRCNLVSYSMTLEDYRSGDHL